MEGTNATSNNDRNRNRNMGLPLFPGLETTCRVWCQRTPRTLLHDAPVSSHASISEVVPTAELTQAVASLEILQFSIREGGHGRGHQQAAANVGVGVQNG